MAFMWVRPVRNTHFSNFRRIHLFWSIRDWSIRNTSLHPCHPFSTRARPKRTKTRKVTNLYDNTYLQTKDSLPEALSVVAAHVNNLDISGESTGSPGRVEELEDGTNDFTAKPSFATKTSFYSTELNQINTNSADIAKNKVCEDSDAESEDLQHGLSMPMPFSFGPLTKFRLARENTVLELYGSPDPTKPITDVPCAGCGALLHCQDPGIKGYLPSQKLLNIPENDLRNTLCQRCMLLEQYNVAVDVSVSPEEFANIVQQTTFEQALILMLVDLTDLPNSIYPALKQLIGSRRRPIYVVGNKVDLLPKDSKGYLNRMITTVQQYMDKFGFSKSHIIRHIALVSAKTGYGIEDLISHLLKHWGRKGHVYVVGCTNVGKSSLFNALLGSDYCNSGARDFIHRATISQWPGTTLSTLKFPILDPTPVKLYERAKRLRKQRTEEVEEARVQKYNLLETGELKYATLLGRIGQTFLGSREKKLSEMDYQGDTSPMFEFKDGHLKPGISSKWHEIKQNLEHSLEEYDPDVYQNSRFCIDTPGIVYQEQILNSLTQKELSVMLTQRLMRPRTYVLKPNQVLFVSGLGRIDYLQGLKSVYFTVIASMRLPVFLHDLSDADEFYNKTVGSEALGVPLGDQKRLWALPSLVGKEFVVSGVNERESAADIVLSSVGWVAITTDHGHKIRVRAYTPASLGCHMRTPSMLPFAVNLRGKRKSHSREFTVKKPKVF